MDAFNELDSTWSAQENSTIELLQAICDQLQPVAAPVGARELKARVDGQVEGWRQLHGAISKYGKTFERTKGKIDLLNLVPLSAAHLADDCALSPGAPTSPLAAAVPPFLSQRSSAARQRELHAIIVEEEAINGAILNHLYREGNFPIAEMLSHELATQRDAIRAAEESLSQRHGQPTGSLPLKANGASGHKHHPAEGGPVHSGSEASGRDGRAPCDMTDGGQGRPGAVDDERCRTLFAQMHRLIASLRERDIHPAVAWIRENAAQLGDSGARLHFHLHSLAFIGLLRERPLDALAYARAHLAPFQAAYAGDVEALMGALAYGRRLEASPYTALLLDDMWGEAEDGLIGSFCAILAMPRESSLALAISVGTTAWPKVSRVMSIMKGRSGVEWNPQEELPIEVDTSLSRFHSVFVCPVLRQQTNATNPPMIMTCGHVLSSEALTRLSRGNANYRIKCPYCPAESTAAMSMQISF